MAVCSIKDCGSSRRVRNGLCEKHYNRWQKYGDPLGFKGAEIGEASAYYRDVVIPYAGNECLIWPYSCVDGYGVLWRDGMSRRVSRLVCEETKGPPPTPQHESAHSCGKGHIGCVTKGHLSWKTPKENSEDKIIHGTSGRGEKNAMAKLTEDQALEILSLRGKEMTKATATRFGVSTSAIEAIQSGRNWACLSSNGPLPAAP